MSPEHNMKTNTSNYNKKQFWSYRRLKSLKDYKTKKHIENNTKNTNTTNTNTTTKNKSKKPKKSKKVHKSFHIINNKVVINKKLISRLDSIYIPPAYKDLIVAKSESNKVQIIGTDNKGRRQYIYNTNYTKKRNSRKYDDVMDLGKSIIKIEKDNITMLNELNKKSYNQWTLH
jgi:DNA topoisomerase IB